MAILNKDEFMNLLKERVGESTADKDLKFLEDMTDTYNELAKNDGLEWKQKYEDLDKSWKQKYKERFFSGSDEKPEKEDKPESKDETEEPLPEDSKLDDIFMQAGETVQPNEIVVG